MYKYSFIIPHHNTPHDLSICLRSIPERDDIQVIIVDDNSDDGKKPDIQHSNTSIIYVDKQHSKGAGHARNVGLKYAEGEWLLFADADDCYVDGFISIIDNFSGLSNIDVLYYGFHYVDKQIGKSLDNQMRICQLIRDYKGDHQDENEIIYRNYAPWSKMVRRSFVISNNIYFEEVLNGNDLLFSLWIGTKMTSYKIISDPIYIYYRNNGGLTYGSLSVPAHFCRYVHFVQLGGFYSKIDKHEWKPQRLRYLMYVLKKDGFCKFASLVLQILKAFPHIISSRYELYEITHS